MAQQLLIIDDWEVPKLIDYETEYNKLYSEDSGRDMTGENKGTLVGVFPKLYVNVGCFTQAEMRKFLKKVNKEKINIDWYDEELGDIRRGISYYISDFKISLKNSKRMTYRAFSFNLIPNKKR